MKQAREVADTQAKSCNVMIYCYNCLRLSVKDAAKDVASTYLSLLKECQIQNSTTALVVLSLLGEGGLCPLWALAFL